MNYEELLTDISRVADEINDVLREVVSDTRSDVLKESSKHLLEAGGKRVRPYIFLKAVQAVGGDVNKSSEYVAAGIELLHNYSLVHDDIMDQDDVRRGRETIHSKWGEDIGILAGDYLFSKVFESISTSGLEEKKIIKVFKVVSRTSSLLCEGQLQDVLFEGRNDVSVEECEDMMFGKTGALFKGAAKAGAIIGTNNDEYIKALSGYGEKVGIGFQIWDDVLDLRGDQEETGKPVGSDIVEGKRTLIVAHFLENSSYEEREEFLDLLGSVSSESNINRAISLLEKTDSISYASDRAEELINDSKKYLRVLNDNEAKKDLEDLADFIIDRSH